MAIEQQSLMLLVYISDSQNFQATVTMIPYPLHAIQHLPRTIQHPQGGSIARFGITGLHSEALFKLNNSAQIKP